MEPNRSTKKRRKKETEEKKDRTIRPKDTSGSPGATLRKSKGELRSNVSPKLVIDAGADATPGTETLGAPPPIAGCRPQHRRAHQGAYRPWGATTWPGGLLTKR
jgi:hypothetical protein